LEDVIYLNKGHRLWTKKEKKKYRENFDPDNPRTYCEAKSSEPCFHKNYPWCNPDIFIRK
jgi:hypothetical protein